MLPNQQEEILKQQKRTLKGILLFKEVFGNKKGEEVLEILKKEYFYDRTTTVTGCADLSSENEGKRCVVLDILNMVNTTKEFVLDLEIQIEKGEKQK